MRQTLICWLDFLDQIPNVSLQKYLPNIIYELFFMLGDQNKDITNTVHQMLFNFMNQMLTAPVGVSLIDGSILDTMVIILEDNRASSRKFNDNALEISLNWLNEYMKLLLNTTPHPSLVTILMTKIPLVLQPVLYIISHDSTDLRQLAKTVNSNILQIIEERSSEFEQEILQLMPIIQDHLLEHNTVESSLTWMKKLFEIYKEKIVISDDIVYKLIQKLAQGDESLISDITDILAQISKNHSYFETVV